MRLAKFLALSGAASRRRAEVLISQGKVTVNGQVVIKPQQRVSSDDLVALEGNLIEGPEEKKYILLNKPDGYISTVIDTHQRPTVINLIRNENARLYPVGRLDYDTTGVLLLTNDGELAYRLTHPRYKVDKEYQALVKGKPGRQAIEAMQKGLIIDDVKTAPAKVKILNSGDVKSLLLITLREGKKRQVKKMFAAIGHTVINLDRVSFAGLNYDKVERGSYRYLTSSEISRLYRMVGL